MLANGPLSVDGKRYYAATLWRMRIKPTSQANGILKSSDLDCYVSVQLPFYRAATARQQKSWDRMFIKLKEHENLHARQALRVCNNLRRSKAKAPRLKSYTNRLKLRDIRLDSLTQHGKLDGVILKDFSEG